MDVREKIITILKNLGYKVFEDVELKGKSGLSYAIDIYAIKEDPFCTLRLAIIIPNTKITKDIVLHAKMIYSDVNEIDRVILINTCGIEKEAYKLAETGLQVLIVDPKALSSMFSKIEQQEEFHHYAFKLLIDEKRAKNIVKEYIINKKLASAKIINVELIYRPYYLIYYRTVVDNKPLFGGVFVNALNGKIENSLASLAPKALSLIQKKLYRVVDVPLIVENPKIDEDSAKKVVEYIFVGENPEIVQTQLVYLPIWKIEIKYRNKTYVLEFDGVSGKPISELEEEPSLIDKILTYIYNPLLFFEKIIKESKKYTATLSSRDKRIIIFILLILFLIIILLFTR